MSPDYTPPPMTRATRGWWAPARGDLVRWGDRMDEHPENDLQGTVIYRGPAFKDVRSLEPNPSFWLSPEVMARFFKDITEDPTRMLDAVSADGFIVERLMVWESGFRMICYYCPSSYFCDLVTPSAARGAYEQPR